MLASQFNKTILTRPSVPFFALVSQIEDVGVVNVETEEVTVWQGSLAYMAQELVGQLHTGILNRALLGPVVL